MRLHHFGKIHENKSRRKNPFPHRNNVNSMVLDMAIPTKLPYFKKMCSPIYSSFCSRARSLIYSVCVIFSVCSIFQNIQMDSNAFVFRFPFFSSVHCSLLCEHHHIHISGAMPSRSTHSMNRKQWKWTNRIFGIAFSWWLTFALVYCHSTALI